MNQDGYTLAETMAALVMIGLAIGGLGQATFLIGRLNQATGVQVAADRHLDAAQRTLDRLLAQAGPFRWDSEAFKGRRSGFVFPCDQGRLCSAELVAGRDQTLLVVQRGGHATASRPLGRLSAPRFAYRDATGLHDVWPYSGNPDGARLTLDAVALVEGRDDAPRPVSVTAIWAQQEATCQFDAISGDCREIAP